MNKGSFFWYRIRKGKTDRQRKGRSKDVRCK